MAFRQIFRGEGALNDLLVGGPVEKVQQQYAGKDGRERHLLVGATHGVELARVALLQDAPAFHDACAATHRLKAEVNDHETANQQPHAVEGVGHRHRAQTTEQRIHGANQAHDPDGCPQQGRAGFDAGQALQIQHALQANGAGIENDGQQHHRVGNQEDDVGNELGTGIKTYRQQLRQRGNPAFQEARQEKQRQSNQRNHGDDLPGHDAQAVGKRRAIQPHHLLGGEVGHQHRCGNQRKRQRAPRQKIAVGAAMVIAACNTPGDEGHQARKK